MYLKCPQNVFEVLLKNSIQIMYTSMSFYPIVSVAVAVNANKLPLTTVHSEL